MFSIFALTLIIGSFGALLYIVSRHLPEIENFENPENLFKDNNRNSIFADLAARIPFENIKARGAIFAEKTLHRTRRLLLKTDNLLMGLIGKIKNGDTNSTPEVKLDHFWQDIAAKEKDAEVHVVMQQVSELDPQVKILKKPKHEIKPKL